MDAFWQHLLVYIASQAKKPVNYYCYLPQFWSYLSHEQAEAQYHKGMREFGVRLFYLIGSNSFLNRWSTQFFHKSFRYWLHPVPVYKDNRDSYNYIGGYFIKSTVSQETADEIDELFENVKRLDDISPLSIIRIFHGESPCSLTISRNKIKGEELKRRVEKFIGKSKDRYI